MKCGKRILAAAVVLLAVFCTGCGENGTRPEVVVDGVSIEVGKTIPKDLIEAGMVIDERGFDSMDLPKRSWSSSIYFGRTVPPDAETEKQAEEAGVDPALFSTVSSRGRIAIANASSSSKQAKLCKIEEVDFFNLEQEYVDYNVTINGINVVRMTEEEMQQNFSGLEKDPEKNIADETVYYQKDGDYTIEFTCYDGMVTGVSVLREFGKSYMPA